MRETRRQDKWKSYQQPRRLARAYAYARGMTYAYGSNNTSKLSDHARARARAIPEEFVAAWRERIFAETGEDPVKFAV